MDREAAEQRGFAMVLAGIAGGTVMSILQAGGFAMFWPSAPRTTLMWTAIVLTGPFLICISVGVLLMIYGMGGLRACALAACLVLAAACVFLLPLGLHQAALRRWSLREAVGRWGGWGTPLVAFFSGWYLGHDYWRRDRGEES